MFIVPLFIAVVFNILLFLVAYTRKTDKLTDFAYGATFIIIAAVALYNSPMTTPAVLLFAMVAIWALRLGAFLVIRIRKIGRDKRFDEFREDFVKFGGFWVLQAVSAWVIMLPAIYFIEHATASFSTLMYIGFAVWLVGLSFETIADLQKYRFNNIAANQGKFISTGLWSKSRHPNYFGEILIWFGVYVFAVSVLSPLHTLFALISPLWISTLIIFVSGIPKLEASADQRWGRDKSYQKYKSETPVLIPKL